MESIELRVNNLVKYNNEIRQVSSIHSDNTIRLKTKNGSEGCYSLLEIEPIELTEDIIRKNARHVIGNEFDFNNDENKLNIVFEWHGDYLIYTGGEGITLSRQITKVHELQNITYALEGFELEIKL